MEETPEHPKFVKTQIAIVSPLCILDRSRFLYRVVPDTKGFPIEGEGGVDPPSPRG
jgi:hypothetical protein